jgi:hypothetical protein
MKITRVVLQKKSLQHFDDDERCLLATAMLALNELNILMTFALATWPEVHPPRNTRDNARAALNLFFYQELACKLLEVWNNLRGDRALGQRSHALSDRARTARNNLAKYFDGTSGAIRLLRNELVFHYDRESTLTALSEFPPDETFDIWDPTGKKGDVRFEIGAKITAALLNARLEPEEGATGFDQFVLQVRQVWEWTCDLLHGILELMVYRGLPSDMREEDIPDDPEPVLPILGAFGRKETPLKSAPWGQESHE